MKSFIDDLNNKIISNPNTYKIKSLPNFPYSNFETLKTNVNSNHAKIISPYNSKILKLVPKKSLDSYKEDILLILPALVIITGLVLTFVLGDWRFLLLIVMYIYIVKLTSQYTVINPLLSSILLIAPIGLLFFITLRQNWLIFTVLYSIILLSTYLIRIHFLNRIKIFCLSREEYFCYFMINDIINLKVNNNLYIYSSIVMAKKIIEDMEKKGII